MLVILVVLKSPTKPFDPNNSPMRPVLRQVLWTEWLVVGIR